MGGNRRHFRVLQERSEEGIASNILLVLRDVMFGNRRSQLSPSNRREPGERGHSSTNLTVRSVTSAQVGHSGLTKSRRHHFRPASSGGTSTSVPTVVVSPFGTVRSPCSMSVRIEHLLAAAATGPNAGR